MKVFGFDGTEDIPNDVWDTFCDFFDCHGAEACSECMGMLVYRFEVEADVLDVMGEHDEWREKIQTWLLSQGVIVGETVLFVRISG